MYLTREQYANLVKRWVSYADLNWKRYSTHSMRRPKSAAIYRATKDLAACQHLLGHKNIGSTAHYLGMSAARALAGQEDPNLSRCVDTSACWTHSPSIRLKRVVRYDNIKPYDMCGVADGQDPEDTSDIVGQGCVEGLPALSRWAQAICLTALTIAAEGGKADVVKPLQGLGSGVFEIALPFKGDAFRVVYAIQLAQEIWVVHAFKKKSTTGNKTPAREIEVVRNRLKHVKEMLS